MIKLACRHFRYHLEGRDFPIYTDHKPLTTALECKSPSWNAWQQSTLADVSRYTIDIRHISGKDNPVAIALSRASIFSIRDSIDYMALAKAQAADPKTAAARTAITGLNWADVPVNNSGDTILCDISRNMPRPFLP